MSRGTDFISRLDLPYMVKTALGTDRAVNLGEWIVEHCEEVVDALVEVGVLRVTAGPTDKRYAVVLPEPPHEHEWGITGRGFLPMTIRLVCDCGEERIVLNKLPIEIPK